MATATTSKHKILYIKTPSFFEDGEAYRCADFIQNCKRLPHTYAIKVPATKPALIFDSKRKPAVFSNLKLFASKKLIPEHSLSPALDLMTTRHPIDVTDSG